MGCVCSRHNLGSDWVILGHCFPVMPPTVDYDPARTKLKVIKKNIAVILYPFHSATCMFSSRLRGVVRNCHGERRGGGGGGVEEGRKRLILFRRRQCR